jgi:hypothetical protein
MLRSRRALQSLDYCSRACFCICYDIFLKAKSDRADRILSSESQYLSHPIVAMMFQVPLSCVRCHSAPCVVMARLALTIMRMERTMYVRSSKHPTMLSCRPDSDCARPAMDECSFRRSSVYIRGGSDCRVRPSRRSDSCRSPTRTRVPAAFGVALIHISQPFRQGPCCTLP